MLVSGFTPGVVPRIAVAPDGTHAAIVERGASRAVVMRIADGAVACELSLAAGDTDLAWIGARVVTVATGESHTDVSLIDPFADRRTLHEIRLETSMRLSVVTGPHALMLGARTAAVLTATDTHVAPYQFLARTLPTVVGVAGNLFVVAMPGTIEEWDPVSRMPKRRLRLPRAATITSLGGSERVLWMTTLQEPARLDVLPIVNRGQPKAHDLPESIKSVHGHPHADLVVCIGAETGRLYAIDLDSSIGARRMRQVATGLDRVDVAGLAIARASSSGTGNGITAPAVVATAIAARAGQPIAIVALAREIDTDARVDEPATSSRGPQEHGVPISSLYDPTGASSSSLDDPDKSPRSSLYDATRRAAASIGDALRAPSADSSSSPPQAAGSRPPISPAAAAARAITMATRAGTPDTHVSVESTRGGDHDSPAEPRAPTAWSEGASELIAKLAALRAAGSEPGSPDAPQRATWRDDAGMWARAVASGTFDRAAPACPPIEAVAARFELPAQLVPALVLIYGSHLAGLEGAAPMDVARVLGRRWDDALGRGRLAELGLAIYERSRVMLAPAIREELDSA